MRVGKWKPIAPIMMVMLGTFIVQTRPTKFINELSTTLVSSYHELYSVYWWYNLIAFTFMSCMILWIVMYRTKGVIVTFTIVSWNLNTAGHGINVIAPFLNDHHILLHINRMIRFPALVSASITFSVWNIILLPYILFFILDTEQKRYHFTKWNLSFRLVQLHICNIIWAVLNTIVTRRSEAMTFDKDDLWYGLLLSLGYGLFYTMILDRIGVHIYPIFSPRSNLVTLTYTLVIVIHFLFHRLWNVIIQHYMDFLSLQFLFGMNVLVVIVSLIISQIVSWKKERGQSAKEEKDIKKEK